MLLAHYLDTLSSLRQALIAERRRLSPSELAEAAALPDEAVPSLAALAHEVRLTWCGPTVEIEGILSAKTGGCPEDGHFCSQSSRFESPVLATPFLDTEEVLAAARETAQLGASEFCIVLAVRGPDERTMGRILELVPLVQAETGLNVAISAGILADGQAERLAAGGGAPLQPQPGDRPVLLRSDRHHPQLGRAVGDLSRRAGRRDGAVLRGAAGDGGK